jgi:hypothetical protein
MLPVFRRFSTADIPTAPNWINNILNPLNVFCETTVQSLNKNLVIGTNVQGQKYTTTFTTLATYAVGDFTPITFQYTGGGQPNCLLLGNITRADGAAILLPVMVSNWMLNLNTNPFTLTVKYIAGLDPSVKYNVVFLAI